MKRDEGLKDKESIMKDAKAVEKLEESREDGPHARLRQICMWDGMG
jgi:hypothetical protein